MSLLPTKRSKIQCYASPATVKLLEKLVQESVLKQLIQYGKSCASVELSNFHKMAVIKQERFKSIINSSIN